MIKKKVFFFFFLFYYFITAGKKDGIYFLSLSGLGGLLPDIASRALNKKKSGTLNQTLFEKKKLTS
jgi:hypothetical protein